MIWARNMMVSTTDLIFPGFINATTGKTNEKQFRGVRLRSSWSLQAVLYADALFFVMWVLSFLCTFDISMSVLKELHGNLVVCMTFLYIIVNVPRLLFGLRGNERDKLELLALFWMTTFIVQGPLLGFILFTDIFTPVLRAFTTAMDTVMMALLLLEFILGTFHLKNLIKDELRIIKLAKLTEISVPCSPPRRPTEEEEEQFTLPVRLGPPGAGTSRSGNENLSQGLGYEEYSTDSSEKNDGNWSSDDDDEDGNDNTQSQQSNAYLRRKNVEDAKFDYKLDIRRLTPEPEAAGEFTADEEEEEEEGNDAGSNVVTSTSDVARQRSTAATVTATRVN